MNKHALTFFTVPLRIYKFGYGSGYGSLQIISLVSKSRLF